MQFDTHTPGESWQALSGQYNVDSSEVEATPQTLDEIIVQAPEEVPTIKKNFTTTNTQAIDPKKPTILLIDDSDAIRTVYAEIFTRAGYNIEEAHDGLAGLDRIKKFQPDIIWTGIAMPRMDGYTLIETLKKNPSLANIPVIICSHQGDMKDHARMQDLGVADFILHGYVSPEEIIDRTHALLQTKEEYIISLDPHNAETQRLVAAHAVDVVCPTGQRLALSLVTNHDKGLSVRFVCVGE